MILLLFFINSAWDGTHNRKKEEQEKSKHFFQVMYSTD